MQSQSYWEFHAPPELKALRERLKSRFGASFVPLPSDPGWLTFELRGQTDKAAQRMLEQEQESLFGNHVADFQILCSQDGRERGISVRFLGNSVSYSNAAPGFWYF